jgi:glycosyltransferase involved in cell wall biosynthesis
VIVRLLHIVSHPIQYHAPLFRRITAEPGIDFRVLFLRDTEGGYFDSGFGRDVRWDVPLRSGYDSIIWDETDWRREIVSADAVWFHGWQGRRMLRAIGHAHALAKPALMRGENNDVAMPDGRGIRGWMKRRFLARIFDRCDVFLAIGRANRDYYRRRGVDPRRIHDMGYAVDNDFFAAGAEAARPHRAALRRSLGFDDRPVVLYAGKFVARKHPEWLLEAWNRAAWPGPRPILVYVGDGEMRTALEHGASPDVRFLGFKNQRELPALYDLADVFVLPAEREPWGLAVNESMACGTAVVVSDQVGCAPDLVDDSCGAVFPCGDIAALSRALIDVLGRADDAGTAARRKIAGWNFEANVRGLRIALDAVTRDRGQP